MSKPDVTLAGKKLSEMMIMSLLSTIGSLIWSFINDLSSKSAGFMNDSFDESVDW